MLLNAVLQHIGVPTERINTHKEILTDKQTCFVSLHTEKKGQKSNSEERLQTTHPPASLALPRGLGALSEGGSSAASCSPLGAERFGRAGPELPLSTHPPRILIPKHSRKTILKIEGGEKTLFFLIINYWERVDQLELHQYMTGPQH